MAGLGEAAGHQGDHGPQGHGFVAGGQVLIAADGAAVLAALTPPLPRAQVSVPQLYHPVAEVDLGEGVERHLRHPPPGDRVKQPLIAIHVAGPDLLLVPQVGRVVLC
jgi:hypothetical protein